jgi:lysophospholipase L1-like esterase
VEQLPYELEFMHKYNLHKLLGLLFDDCDIRSIARVYGIKRKRLKNIEDRFGRNIVDLAEKLRGKIPPKPSGKDYTIAAIGDSITSDRESWVKILKNYWEESGRPSIIDCSVSGDTTYDLINRYYSTILNESFEWAVLFIGTNDSRELEDDAHISNISLDEYKRNMNFIIQSLINRKVNIINVTIPYVDNSRIKNYFPDTHWCYDRKRIDKTNDFIRELSKKFGTHLADLAQALAKFKGELLERDGVHLNGHGQLILCELLLKILP